MGEDHQINGICAGAASPGPSLLTSPHDTSRRVARPLQWVRSITLADTRSPEIWPCTTSRCAPMHAARECVRGLCAATELRAPLQPISPADHLAGTVGHVRSAGDGLVRLRHARQSRWSLGSAVGRQCHSALAMPLGRFEGAAEHRRGTCRCVASGIPLSTTSAGAADLACRGSCCDRAGRLCSDAAAGSEMRPAGSATVAKALSSPSHPEWQAACLVELCRGARAPGGSSSSFVFHSVL